VKKIKTKDLKPQIIIQNSRKSSTKLKRYTIGFDANCLSFKEKSRLSLGRMIEAVCV
jgi:hypothetical protein